MTFYENLTLADLKAIPGKKARGSNPKGSAMPNAVFAVTPFGNTAQSVEYAWLGAGIMNQLMTELAQPGRITVADRSRMDACLKEIELSLSDLTAPETAKRIGKFLVADYVISGDYQILGKSVLINMRVTETDTAVLAYAGNVRSSLDESLFVAQKKLVRTFLETFGNGKVPETESSPDAGPSLSALRAFETAYAEYAGGHPADAKRRLETLLGESPEYDAAALLLAGILQADGEYEKTRELIMRRIRLRDDGSDEHSAVLARYFIRLGQLEMALARTIEDRSKSRDETRAYGMQAERALMRAMSGDSGKDPELRAEILNALAVYEDLRADFLREKPRPIARAYSYSAAEEQIPVYGLESAQGLGVMLMIGKSYINESKTSKARSFLEEAARIAENNALTNIREYNMVLQFIGVSYLRDGDKRQAKKYLEESYAIKKRLYGPNAGDAIKIRKILDALDKRS